MPKSRRGSVGREIRTIQKSLSTIGRAIERLAPALQATVAGGGVGSRPRRRLKLTPARRAALKLQGQYMGYVRNLKPRQKTQVKAVKESKGIRAAIVMARRFGAR